MVFPETEQMRFDLQVIASWIDPGSRVLDLGCGNGELLAWLTVHKKVSGVGIELDEEKAASCIANGLSVLQGDFNDEVDDYPDKRFDYVILSQTLQQVYEPARLLYSLSRIGRRLNPSVLYVTLTSRTATNQPSILGPAIQMNNATNGI